MTPLQILTIIDNLDLSMREIKLYVALYFHGDSGKVKAKNLPINVPGHVFKSLAQKKLLIYTRDKGYKYKLLEVNPFTNRKCR